ncbi:hypothetical protein JXB12_12675 [candidate division KSB1 bacterium]|nr:hypothetical protein [candidate division KSB1 bacterium]
MNLENKLKILHIAPVNTAGVPYAFMDAERQLGYQSRLVTLHRHPNNFPEDICLDLPFFTFPGIDTIKSVLRQHRTTIKSHNFETSSTELPPKWKPANAIEKGLIHQREKLWSKKIAAFCDEIDLPSFDIIQLDGGLGFYRDARIIESLKRSNKTIVCCYTGSDLRIRGVIPAIDRLSDLNVTVEFDHLKLHPNIHHVFFPFNWKDMPEPTRRSSSNRVIIGHAPTNRAAKGSDIIIRQVQELEALYPIELMLIENVSYRDALRLKSTCDIFIDQIGNLGYGINSLEALAMKIPTCSCLASGFELLYPDHPFVTIDESNMKSKLIELIEDTDLRAKTGQYGHDWVIEHHDSLKVVCKIHQLIEDVPKH